MGQAAGSLWWKKQTSNDPRPHYFHQSNLAEDGTFYLVFDEVLRRHDSYFTVDLVQPTFGASGHILARTTAWNGVKDVATAYYEGGRVYLSAPTSVHAPMTGIPSGDLYGGERSAWVAIGASPVVVDLGRTVWSTPTGTTTTVVEVRVGSRNDDVEELSNGQLYVDSSDLELTQDAGVQTIGLRFGGVAVPAGATIVGAWVQFTVDEATTGATSLSLRGRDVGNAAGVSGNFGVSGLAMTAAPVPATPSPWPVVGAAADSAPPICQSSGHRQPDRLGLGQRHGPTITDQTNS